MATEAGEYIVGAYLQHTFGCGVILYNARLPGGKLLGLNELDVVGINLPDKTAYLCEVTTHIGGMLPKTADRIPAKHAHQKKYATATLAGFDVRYMLWSPFVPKSLIAKLKAISPSLELFINADFAKAVDELREIAKKTKHDTGNPFMRTMQILEHLRK